MLASACAGSRARDRTPKNGYIHKQLAPSCLHNKLEEPISRVCGGARAQTDRCSRRESANERTCFSTCTSAYGARIAALADERKTHILQLNLVCETSYEYYMNENRFRFLSSFSPHVNGVLLLVAAILWPFCTLRPSLSGGPISPDYLQSSLSLSGRHISINFSI